MHIYINHCRKVGAWVDSSVLSKSGKTGFLHEIKKNRYIYLLAIPGILYFLIFNYLPMFGIIIAFKEYQIDKGIIGSQWNGLKNFVFFFTSGHAWRVTRNTILLNMMFIATITFCQVTVSIMLNEVKNKLFKRVSQSIMFLPFFMSWIVVSVIVMGLLESDTGTVNSLLSGLGLEQVSWYSRPELWPAILAVLNIWKWTGYGVVIFLATISGIDNEYYEAATIDGANKFQQIIHITLPLLVPTIMILTLLSIGRIFFGDFGMIYGLIGDNAMLFPTTDVIDTYVYRALRQMSDFGMAGAVGLYQSVMGFILVFASNQLARRYKSDGALF